MGHGRVWGSRNQNSGHLFPVVGLQTSDPHLQHGLGCPLFSYLSSVLHVNTPKRCPLLPLYLVLNSHSPSNPSLDFIFSLTIPIFPTQ